MEDDNQTTQQTDTGATSGENQQSQQTPPTRQGQAGQQSQQAQQPPASFDEWLTGQDETIKGLVTGHISKLQSALTDERQQRRSLAKQIEDLTKQAEQGSELRKQLEKLSGDLDGMGRKVAFYESAPPDCTNTRLAWLAASDAGLIGKDGTVDWAKIKEQNPELFRRPVTPPGNAGSGAKQAGAADARNMNDFIRAASGRPT